MKSTEEKPQQINELVDCCSSVRASLSQNEPRTGPEIDTPLTPPCSLDVPELRRHLRMRSLTAAPVLKPFLSNLGQQLKSWDHGGNRPVLRGNIERTLQAIEKLFWEQRSGVDLIDVSQSFAP